MSNLKTKALEAALKYVPSDVWVVPLIREALDEPTLDFEKTFKSTRAYARLLEIRGEEYIFTKDGERYVCGTTDDAYDIWKLAGGK